MELEAIQLLGRGFVTPAGRSAPETFSSLMWMDSASPLPLRGLSIAARMRFEAADIGEHSWHSALTDRAGEVLNRTDEILPVSAELVRRGAVHVLHPLPSDLALTREADHAVRVTVDGRLLGAPTLPAVPPGPVISVRFLGLAQKPGARTRAGFFPIDMPFLLFDGEACGGYHVIEIRLPDGLRYPQELPEVILPAGYEVLRDWRIEQRAIQALDACLGSLLGSVPPNVTEVMRDNFFVGELPSLELELSRGSSAV